MIPTARRWPRWKAQAGWCSPMGSKVDVPDVEGGSMSIANEPRPGLPSALGFEDLHVEESNQRFGVSTGGDRVAMVRDGHSLGFV